MDTRPKERWPTIAVQVLDTGEDVSPCGSGAGGLARPTRYLGASVRCERKRA